MPINLPTVSEVELISYRFAYETMNWGEPIPDFVTRFPGVLERCLGQLQQTYDGQELYPGLIKKASILFYLMIKNHPFPNGNKRLAITTLLTFLYRNKKWIAVDQQELYLFAKRVAESDSVLSKNILKEIEIFFEGHIIKKGLIYFLCWSLLTLRARIKKARPA